MSELTQESTPETTQELIPEPIPEPTSESISEFIQFIPESSEPILESIQDLHNLSQQTHTSRELNLMNETLHSQLFSSSSPNVLIPILTIQYLQSIVHQCFNLLTRSFVLSC